MVYENDPKIPWSPFEKGTAIVLGLIVLYFSLHSFGVFS